MDKRKGIKAAEKLAAQGAVEQAIAEYQKLLATDPEDADLRERVKALHQEIIRSAEQLAAKGKLDKAIAEYQKILEQEPKDTDVLQRIGVLYQKKKNVAQATHFLTLEAEVHYRRGHFKKAISAYTQVFTMNPAAREVALILSHLYGKLSLMTEAAKYEELADAISDTAEESTFLSELSWQFSEPVSEDVADWIKVAEHFARRQLNNKAIKALGLAAEYLERDGRKTDYMQVADAILRLDPKNLTLAKELARIYLDRGDNERAGKILGFIDSRDHDLDILELLAQALRPQKGSPQQLAVLKALAGLRKSGPVDKYIKVLEELCSLEPNNLQWARDLVGIYYGRGKREDALTKVQLILARNGKDFEMLNLQIRIMEESGDRAKTIAANKQAAKAYEDVDRIHQAGPLWAKVGQLDAEDPDWVARGKPDSK